MMARTFFVVIFFTVLSSGYLQSRNRRFTLRSVEKFSRRFEKNLRESCIDFLIDKVEASERGDERRLRTGYVLGSWYSHLSSSHQARLRKAFNV